MTPFYGWGLTASKVELFRGGSLLFTTKYLQKVPQYIVNRNLYTPGLQFSFMSYRRNFRSMSTTMKHFEAWY